MTLEHFQIVASLTGDYVGIIYNPRGIIYDGYSLGVTYNDRHMMLVICLLYYKALKTCHRI